MAITVEQVKQMHVQDVVLHIAQLDDALRALQLERDDYTKALKELGLEVNNGQTIAGTPFRWRDLKSGDILVCIRSPADNLGSPGEQYRVRYVEPSDYEGGVPLFLEAVDNANDRFWATDVESCFRLVK